MRKCGRLGESRRARLAYREPMSKTNYISTNPPLLLLLLAGATLTVIGAAIWAASTDFDASAFTRDTTDPAGQAIGVGLASLGGVLLTAGWAVAAVLRHLVGGGRPSRIPH